MNSRVLWSVDGIDPSVRERAEAAARRAGMSLSDWLNSTIGEPLPPSFSTPSLDFAIAEIAARQNELDGPPPRQMPPRHAAPTASPAQSHSASPNFSQAMMQAAPAGPDFSSLERHLLKITSQIEALQRPDHVEESIAAFRSELAEIRQAITEAVPRREIESLENEIRSLSRRIDDSREHGSDGQ